MCRLHVVELQQRDLAGLTWGQFDSVCRADVPVLARYRFKELPWVAVCLLSPKRTALLALRVYPAFSMALREWTASRADEGSTFRRFLKELEVAGVAADSEAVAFLGQYSAWGVYGKRYSSPFLKGSANPLSQGRWLAMVVPAEAERVATDYLEKQLEEFGRHSFIEIADESLVVRYEPNTSRRLTELNDPLFEWPCGYAEDEMSVSPAEIVNRLRELGSAEAVGKYLGSIHPVSVLTMSPCFRLGSEAPQGVEDVFKWRAAALAVADAPWLVPVMAAQELAIRRKIAVDVGVQDVGSELLANIGEFMSRMESKYPVIVSATKL